ncbi:auxin efflux carrier [Mycotypha africana]|uniref:auxin efflux carrier n=1 Tax=Mycotypha africana TaxID=64632 RepID=UPI002300BCA2|nr:auxin efflux carrier [Mycotypha africana]KAI8983933.1 auxin efflux carrier [Mycotypha africana]
MQVMVIVLSGAFLSYKGYIDEDKQKWLSKLNLTFFTPCLLFSNIASVISLDKFTRYWPIPIFYFTFATLSWFLCHLITPFFRVSNLYKRFITSCVVFNNANSLPVAIISSLAVSEAGKTLFWGDDDNQKNVSSRGIAYVLFFGLFSNLLRWSYGYNILKNEDEDEDENTVFEDESSCSSVPKGKTTSYGSVTEDNNRRKYSNVSSSTSTSSSSGSQQRKNQQKESTTLLNCNSKNSEDSPLPLIAIKKFFISIDKFMSPPLYAAILAIMVGITTPLKTLLYDEDKFLYVSFTKGIESCGKASIPLVLVCLGAQLKCIRQSQKDGSVTPPEYRKPVFLSIFIRNLIMPCFVLPIVYFFARFGGGFSKLQSDPMFIVSMIVVGCTPTAINLAQITQVNGAFEREMLSVLFWSYGLVCIPISTFVIFLGLLLVKHVF